MAVIKKGEHIQDIRGAVKNHVYSDWRGKGYLRSKAINPSNPRSSAQAALRSSMPRFSHLWSRTLTDAQRALWNEYAQREGKIKGSRSMARQIIPPPGVIGSGFNMFVRNNILLQTAGIQVPPAYLAVPPDSSSVTSSPTSLAGAWYLGPDVAFSETFEDELNGATPNLWTPAWFYFAGLNSSLSVSNAESHGGLRSCKAHKAAAGTLSKARIQQTGLLVNNAVLSFYILSKQITKTMGTLYVQDLLDVPAVTVAFWSAGTIRYNDGGVWKIARPYVANVWYKIAITMHDATETYDLSINDVVIAAGIAYRNVGVTGNYLFIAAGGAIAEVKTWYVDDIRLTVPVTPGIRLTWTDPVDASVGSRIRAWLRSYGTSAHLQQVDTIALGEEAVILSQIRTAQGKTTDISNLPGEYKLQLDSVSPEGRQSAPSNLVEVTVPST